MTSMLNSRHCACTAWPAPGPIWSSKGRLPALESSRWLIEHLLQAETHRPCDALGQPPDARRQVPGASRPGRLRLRGLAGGPQAGQHLAERPSPTTRTTSCWWAGPSTRHDAHLATSLKLKGNLLEDLSGERTCPGGGDRGTDLRTLQHRRRLMTHGAPLQACDALGARRLRSCAAPSSCSRRVASAACSSVNSPRCVALAFLVDRDADGRRGTRAPASRSTYGPCRCDGPAG